MVLDGELLDEPLFAACLAGDDRKVTECDAVADSDIRQAIPASGGVILPLSVPVHVVQDEEVHPTHAVQTNIAAAESYTRCRGGADQGCHQGVNVDSEAQPVATHKWRRQPLGCGAIALCVRS